MLSNTMAHKNQHIALLNTYFKVCINTLREQSISFFEDIECSSNMLRFIEAHAEYCLSLQESMLHGQKIALGDKSYVDIQNLLNEFANKYNVLTIQDYKNCTYSTSVVKSMFFEDALKAMLNIILTIGTQDNCNIHLNEQSGFTHIEIKFDIDQSKATPIKVERAINKARLFALLDDGVIKVFYLQDTLIIAIIFGIKLS